MPSFLYILNNQKPGAGAGHGLESPVAYLRAACPTLLGPCHHRFDHAPPAEPLTVFSALVSAAHGFLCVCKYLTEMTPRVHQEECVLYTEELPGVWRHRHLQFMGSSVHGQRSPRVMCFLTSANLTGRHALRVCLISWLLVGRPHLCGAAWTRACSCLPPPVIARMALPRGCSFWHLRLSTPRRQLAWPFPGMLFLAPETFHPLSQLAWPSPGMLFLAPETFTLWCGPRTRARLVS